MVGVVEDLPLERVERVVRDIVVVEENDVILGEFRELEEVVLVIAVSGVAVVVPAAGSREDDGPLVARRKREEER